MSTTINKRQSEYSTSSQNTKKLKQNNDESEIKDVVYIVIREEINEHSISTISIRGVYKHKITAINAAKCDLTDEWSQSFFDKYRSIKTKDGLIKIKAICPEGEIMKVWIEKKIINTDEDSEDEESDDNQRDEDSDDDQTDEED
ncbi:unnamed protein product [Didymodactylos carnosus]|uniref:Uncharacterized protein n=2 Tax=Didymodactylos carnosus TaxID=1234261 RepID=A0A815BHH7_9BILA|nr:unnamed protein product [Didymodactylos carnosus]CAF4062075.1 unnamed protein product [Didymodactylos carnosus]